VRLVCEPAVAVGLEVVVQLVEPLSNAVRCRRHKISAHDTTAATLHTSVTTASDEPPATTETHRPHQPLAITPSLTMTIRQSCRAQPHRTKQLVLSHLVAVAVQRREHDDGVADDVHDETDDHVWQQRHLHAALDPTLLEHHLQQR
jgi:hypothetical protein